MAKHTPGPWEVEFDEGGWGEGHTIRMASAIESPHAHRTHHRIEYEHGLLPGDKGFEEAQANAHLIAAAPELLDALRGMDELVEALWKSVDWRRSFLSGDDIARLNDAPTMAKRALARAEGMVS